jgi:SMC interacting uncharacterized protein involved in chromosome segregation
MAMDFGFSAVDEIPQQQPSYDPQPIQEDVEGINDNILRIEQKLDSVLRKFSEYDDEFNLVKEHTEDEVKSRLVEVEKLIMPLLVNLLKTADKDYIHWPNRQEKVQSQIDKLLSITRGEKYDSSN